MSANNTFNVQNIIGLNKGINVLSLFDGMSCGRIALERAGIKVDNYFASEIDKYAIQIATKNYPDTKHIGSVVDVKLSDFPQIDLLIGGSPCQGFSFAGKQLNFEDERSKLFFEFVRLLEECKPKYFLLENVKMKKEYQDVITKYLGVEPIKINSALVSAQNRERLYWTNIPNIEQPQDKGILLKDILEDGLNGSLRPCEVKEFNENSACHHAANATDIKGHKCIKRVYADSGKAPTLTTMGGGHREPKVLIEKVCNVNPSGNGMNGNVYGVNAKCPTLTTNKGEGIKILMDETRTLIVPEATKKGYVEIQPGECVDLTFINSKTRRGRAMREKSNCLTATNYDYSHWNGYSYRKLTPIECERLQTVPDNYTDGVSNSQRYKMLGNGWTVDVIAHILKGIK